MPKITIIQQADLRLIKNLLISFELPWNIYWTVGRHNLATIAELSSRRWCVVYRTLKLNGERVLATYLGERDFYGVLWVLALGAFRGEHISNALLSQQFSCSFFSFIYCFSFLLWWTTCPPLVYFSSFSSISMLCHVCIWFRVELFLKYLFLCIAYQMYFTNISLSDLIWYFS